MPKYTTRKQQILQSENEKLHNPKTPNPLKSKIPQTKTHQISTNFDLIPIPETIIHNTHKTKPKFTKKHHTPKPKTLAKSKTQTQHNKIT